MKGFGAGLQAEPSIPPLPPLRALLSCEESQQVPSSHRPGSFLSRSTRSLSSTLLFLFQEGKDFAVTEDPQGVGRGGQRRGEGGGSSAQHCSASTKPSFSWPAASTSAYVAWLPWLRNFMAGQRCGRRSMKNRAAFEVGWLLM